MNYSKDIWHLKSLKYIALIASLLLVFCGYKLCVFVFVQGEWGPEGPVEEVCGGGTDAEERGEPGQWW